MTDDDGHAIVFVEIPAGSRNKYEYDEELGGIVLDRRLFTSMTYPADYGFVEGTLAEDGDPLDALVLVSDRPPAVVTSELGDAGGALGAALLVSEPG